jgi:hypothetical protein
MATDMAHYEVLNERTVFANRATHCRRLKTLVLDSVTRTLKDAGENVYEPADHTGA